MTGNLPEVTGHYVVIDKTRVYYDQCGSEGPVILCIHPGGTNSMQFYEFIQVMAGRGFRAIAIDLPGHGKSYPIDWQPVRSMHDYAEFMRKFLRIVFPDDKPIVCGAAVGGGIALELAVDHPDEILAALVLDITAAPEGDQFTRYCHWWESPHAMPSWRDFAERVAMSGVYGVSGDRLQEFRWQHRYCAQEVGTADLQCWATHDVRARLGNVACPLLVFKGEADYWVPEEGLDAIVAAVPNGLAEKAIGRGMGHYASFEAPEAMATIVIDFLHRRGLAPV
ncbi:alpha/beta fold hydrolase [Arthrobacter sp. KNU40]|uniref:alpha/beta fold hydrolase n=1 Tax=Arthrobacter sp. KNU40 TaxID=3447965 RepID=UPI003F6198B4